MSHKPEGVDERLINEQVKQKLESMLSSISSISTMYVEPDDVVLVKIENSNELSDKNMQEMASIIKKLFPDNSVLVVDSLADISVIRRETEEKINLESRLSQVETELYELKNKD